MNTRPWVALLGAPILAVTTTAALAVPSASAYSGAKLSAVLTGETEVPGPGDPDGTGVATLTVNPGHGTICYTLTVSDIAPAVAAHIHEGSPGVAGPVVETLETPTPTSSGCVTNKALAKEIIRDPTDYYVNVHNADYPAGAVRGQLTR